VIERLTDIVLIVGGFQLLLLAGILLGQPRRERARGAFFVAFLLAKACLILRWASQRFGILPYADHVLLYQLSAAGFFLLAPLLYRYIRALGYRSNRLRTRDLLHLIPFAVIFLGAALRVRIFYAYEGDVPAGPVHVFVSRYWDLFWTANFVQILAYLVAIIRALRTHRERVRDQYSTLTGIDLRWVRSLVAVMVLYWLFVVSRGTLGLLGVEAGQLTAGLDLFSISIFLAFTSLLVIRGVGQLRIFAGIEEKPRTPANGKLSDEEIERFSERLDRFMETEKPHLWPSLTLDDLAGAVSLPSWQLSQVINRGYGLNFFHFINQHRVHEAQVLLLDPASKRKTILQILHEAGFNSKSTFNEAFKRHAGMTPRTYRQSQHPLHAGT